MEDEGTGQSSTNQTRDTGARVEKASTSVATIAKIDTPNRETVEVWYLTPYGHANRPNYALKDRFGNPLISPGPVKNILKLIERNHRKAHKQIWEDLLDNIEQFEQMQAEGWGMRDPDVATLVGKGQALVRTLAILEYGNEFREDPDAAYALVTAKAQSMFED